jgi:hypothetical protein
MNDSYDIDAERSKGDFGWVPAYELGGFGKFRAANSLWYFFAALS